MKMSYLRRALDVTLRWMDSSLELCTLESMKKMVSDVVNFLPGMSLGPTTTTTTTITTAATTIATDTTAPTQPTPKHSQHDNTSTQLRFTPANALPPPIDACPQRECLPMNTLGRI
ncbi:hypothetical protein Syun_025458 [Stephania yunnanensis]|uniref:Uncharacterized protein n=1 Tax=Stephania yunnanensis TaxID=152371 RepID=A0AAP0HRA0_9MAGN